MTEKQSPARGGAGEAGLADRRSPSTTGGERQGRVLATIERNVRSDFRVIECRDDHGNPYVSVALFEQRGTPERLRRHYLTMRPQKLEDFIAGLSVALRNMRGEGSP